MADKRQVLFGIVHESQNIMPTVSELNPKTGKTEEKINYFDVSGLTDEMVKDWEDRGLISKGDKPFTPGLGKKTEPKVIP